VRDQLGDHRVVGEIHLVPFGHARIHPHARGEPQPLDPPALRQERARVLGVQPHLDGVAEQLERRELQRFPRGDAQLLAHEVDAGHELRHRMLDLDARVQLQEVEVAVRVEHELGRACAAVADRARERHGSLAHPRPERGIERRRGRLLQDLLVAPLHRALALAQRHDRAVRVREQLDLDVPRALHVPLEEDRVVAERRLRLPPRGCQRVVELVRPAYDAHAAAAAAARRLHEQRIPELVRRAFRHDGHAGLPRHSLRRQLVAGRADGRGRRADPDEPRRLDRLGEVRVLGQEAVAGVHGVRAGFLGGPDVLGRIEVGRDVGRLVRRAEVERAAVVRRRDGDRRDPQLAARAEDAECDLPAVRYEQLSYRSGQGA
jgi:hypothetical protein